MACRILYAYPRRINDTNDNERRAILLLQEGRCAKVQSLFYDEDLLGGNRSQAGASRATKKGIVTRKPLATPKPPEVVAVAAVGGSSGPAGNEGGAAGESAGGGGLEDANFSDDDVMFALMDEMEAAAEGEVLRYY